MYILWLSFTALAAAVLVLDPSWSRCRRRLLIIDDDDPESKRKDRRRTSVVLRKSPGRVIIINIIILIKSRVRKRATCCRCSHRFSHPRRPRERSFYITRARVYVYYSVIYHFRAIESKKANPKTIAAVLLHSDADSMRWLDDSMTRTGRHVPSALVSNAFNNNNLYEWCPKITFHSGKSRANRARTHRLVKIYARAMRVYASLCVCARRIITIGNEAIKYYDYT